MAKSQRVYTPEFRRQMVELHRAGRLAQDISAATRSLEVAARQLVRAERRGRRPCVVLAHNLAGIKEMRLDAFAEELAEAGHHALIFDYRHFGVLEHPGPRVDFPRVLPEVLSDQADRP